MVVASVAAAQVGGGVGPDGGNAGRLRGRRWSSCTSRRPDRGCLWLATRAVAAGEASAVGSCAVALTDPSFRRGYHGRRSRAGLALAISGNAACGCAGGLGIGVGARRPVVGLRFLPVWVEVGLVRARQLRRLELGWRRGLGSGLVWLLLWPWVAPRQLGRSAAAATGMFWRRPVRRRPMSSFYHSPRRPGIAFVEGLAFSQLRSIARLTLGVAGPSLSRARQQDQARLAPGSRTELISSPAAGPSSSCARCCRTDRWRPVLAGLLGFGAGGRPGVRKAVPFRSSLWLG